MTLRRVAMIAVIPWSIMVSVIIALRSWTERPHRGFEWSEFVSRDLLIYALLYVAVIWALMESDRMFGRPPDQR